MHVRLQGTHDPMNTRLGGSVRCKHGEALRGCSPEGLHRATALTFPPSGEAVAAALQTRRLLPCCRHRSGPLSASPLPPCRGWCCCCRHQTLLVSLLQNTTENLLIELILFVAEPCCDVSILQFNFSDTARFLIHVEIHEMLHFWLFLPFKNARNAKIAKKHI